jgi:hypothetical protein
MYNCGICCRILTQRLQIAALKLVRSTVQQITSTPNQTKINLRFCKTVTSTLVYCSVLRKSTWNYMLVSVYRLVLSIGTIISFNVTVKVSTHVPPANKWFILRLFLSLPVYRRFLTDKSLIESIDVSRSFGRFSLNLASLLKFVEKF